MGRFEGPPFSISDHKVKQDDALALSYGEGSKRREGTMVGERDTSSTVSHYPMRVGS